MNRLFTVCILTSLFLLPAGCSSFNHTIIITNFSDLETKEAAKQIENSDNKTSDSKETQKQDNESLIEVCPVFYLPNLPPTPGLPLRAIEKINPNDKKAVDKIEQEHIIELRRYIVELKQYIRNEHNSYLSKCSEYMLKNRK